MSQTNGNTDENVNIDGFDSGETMEFSFEESPSEETSDGETEFNFTIEDTADAAEAIRDEKKTEENPKSDTEILKAKMLEPKEKIKNDYGGKIGLKNLLALGIFAFLLLASLSIFIAIKFSVSSNKESVSEAYVCAAAIANDIDGETTKKYIETEETDEKYFEICEYLKQIREAQSKVKYISVIVPNEDTYMFVYDADYDISAEEGYQTLGYVQNYGNIPYAEVKYAFENIDYGTPHYYHDEEYGDCSSAFYPIFDKDGNSVALVEVDIDVLSQNDVIISFAKDAMVYILLALLFGILLYYRFINKNIIKPINVLNSAVLDSMSNLENDEDIHIDIHTKDEIETLARNYEQMTHELKEYINVSSKLEAKQKIMEGELQLAKSIQADMLPNRYPNQLEISMYGSMEPAKSVGGDFYDYFYIDADHLALVIGDVSGKGVPASLFMVRSMMSIRSYAMQHLPVEEVFTKANNELCAGNESELFTTAWFGIYEISTGKISYTDAGHDDPVCVRNDGRIDSIKPSKKCLVLGAIEDVSYSSNEMVLGKDEILVLYTDGLPEANNENEELYGMERFEASAKKNEDKAKESLDAFMHAIRQDVRDFVGGAEQFDDLTTLAILRKE